MGSPTPPPSMHLADCPITLCIRLKKGHSASHAIPPVYAFGFAYNYFCIYCMFFSWVHCHFYLDFYTCEQDFQKVPSVGAEARKKVDCIHGSYPCSNERSKPTLEFAVFVYVYVCVCAVYFKISFL